MIAVYQSLFFFIANIYLPSKFNCFQVIHQDEGDDNEPRKEGRSKKSKGRKKPAYTGGLVLEPKKGECDCSF